MASRSLTKQFLEIRSAAKANRSLRSHDEDDTDFSLLNKQSDTTNWKAVHETLPPKWVDKIASIEEVISNIKSQSRELTKLHNKRLKVDFNSDESLQEQEIDEKTTEITRLFGTAQTALASFGKMGDETKISDAEFKTRQNIQKSVAQRVQTLNSQFRNSQKEYFNKLNAQKHGSGAAAFKFLEEQSVQTSKAPILGVDTGFSEQQLLGIESDEIIIDQRDEEIQKIAKSIEELAAIFKELAVLVIDQGTILDRIDYNMETAVEHGKEGLVQLHKADEHQKNALPFRCIVVLVVLIAIMLAVLIWKHSGK